MRLIILLNNIKVSKWVADIIHALHTDPDFEIVLAVFNTKSDANGIQSATTYRMLRAIDRKMFSTGENPFVQIAPDLGSIPVLKMTPEQTRFSDRVPSDALQIIRQSKPDVILRFGFRILRGEILRIAPYGVWSLHHGDTEKYRGGPPAFWEVVRREPVTAVTLQMLTDSLDGGIVLNRAFQRTDFTSFHRNQVKLYHAGVELFLQTLKEFVKANSPETWMHNKRTQDNVPVYSSPLYTNPGSLLSLYLFIQHGLFTLWRMVRQSLFFSQWQIMLHAGNHPWYKTAIYRMQVLKPLPDRIWADPFVIKQNGHYILFLEEKKRSDRNGHISAWQLDMKGAPATPAPEPVLKEKHHMSYPFVFEFRNEWYMCPEAAESHQIALYKARQFPYDWVRVATILDNVQAFDPTLLEHEGKWYLFCTMKNYPGTNSDMYLHIYFSDDLLSAPFTPHPLNPVYRDVRLARPAGRIFKDDLGRLIRPAQICAPVYGFGIRFFEIQHLSPTVFEERLISDVKPEWKKDVMAIHTWNTCEGLIATDGQVKKFKWSW